MAKRLVAKTGEYEKGGETKGEYVRLGVLMGNDNGEYLLLDPTVSLSGVLAKQRAYAHSQGKKMQESVLVSIFTDEPRQQQNNQSRQQASQDFQDDQIPF